MKMRERSERGRLRVKASFPRPSHAQRVCPPIRPLLRARAGARRLPRVSAVGK